MNNRKPLIFFFAWLIISLVQVYFTKLSSDEGYYWFYSTHLQWGYYDHPPMMALLIKTGYSLFQNELGVRLLNVLVTSFSFLLMFRFVPERLKQKNYIYLILLAQPLLNYFSILIFPDGPLLFFSLIYLLGYKRLLEKNDLLSAWMLALSLAGMFYSKYHGILLPVFLILSNFKLLKSKWFWTSLFISLLLVIPHLWWQYRNDFSSFRYHLFYRTTAFSWSHVAEFISQQIPAIGPLFLIAGFGFKSEDQFEKTLKYIFWGTMIFFFFSSFRGFVHFHWTSLALFPLILISIRYFEDTRRKRLMYWFTIPFILIIILYRIHIVSPFLPFKQNDLGYYKNRNKWAKDISQIAAGRPVLFIENFREAGLYTFYTGRFSSAAFNNSARKTQYDLWGYEDSLQGKEVLLVGKNNFPGCIQLYSRMNKMIYYLPVKNFESYYNILTKTNLSEIKNDTLHISMEIINDRNTDLNFYANTFGQQPVLFYQVKENKKIINTDTLKIFSEKDKIISGGIAKFDFDIPLNKFRNGTYNFTTGFYYGSLPPAFISVKNYFRIKI